MGAVSFTAAITLLLAPAGAAAEQLARRAEGPQVVLVQNGGTGAREAASFALYADGTVIFRAPADEAIPSGYLSTRLSAAEHRQLTATIAPAALSGLGESYVVVTSGEAPMHLLHVWADGSRKTISVFGDPSGALARSRLPAALRRALHALASFSAPAASPWVPPSTSDSVWLCLRPHIESTEASLGWPIGVWPFRGSLLPGYDCYTLDPVDFAPVHQLLVRLGPRQNVALRNRLVRMSYRLRLPFEERWERDPRESPLVDMPPRLPVARLFGEGAPLAVPSVVLEVSGWGGPADRRDAAVFVLYSDGLLLVRKESAPAGYVAARLSRQEYRALVAAIAPERLLGLEGHYSVMTGTDPPSQVLHVWVGGRRTSVAVSGHIGTSADCRQDPQAWCASRAALPAAFVRAYDAISASANRVLEGKESGTTRPWLPAFFELSLQPTSAPGEAPVAWPKGWPTLEHARTYANGRHELLLPGDQLSRLRKLAPDRQQGATVRIANLLWRLEFRGPLPHEDTWLR